MLLARKLMVAPFVFRDDFNRADQALESSANWDDVSDANASPDVVSNQLKMTSTSLNVNAKCLYTGALANDQYAEVEYVSNAGSFAQTISLIVRSNYSTTDYYRFFHRADTDEFFLRESTGGTETDLVTKNTTYGGLVSGDVMRIEVSGTSIECFVNGTSMFSTTDSTHSAGQAGLISFLSRDNNEVILDNFECGDL